MKKQDIDLPKAKDNGNLQGVKEFIVFLQNPLLLLSYFLY